MIRQPSAPRAAKQERLALLLASGRGIKVAAAEVGVGERTAHTWLDDAGFRRLVAVLRGRLLDEALSKLAGGAGAAVEVLKGLLDHPNAHVRLRSALGILDALLKYREHVELDRRLLDLEGRVGDDEAPGSHRIA
jgi:hypothetical protein